jgi:hypothetical protein
MINLRIERIAIPYPKYKIPSVNMDENSSKERRMEDVAEGKGRSISMEVIYYL